MRKRTIILSSALALSLATYSAMWWYSATHLKAAVEQSLANIEPGSSIQKVKYESISVSGFPFSVNVNLEKPYSKVDIQALLNQTPNVKAKKVAEFERPYMFELYTEKSLTISTNIIKSRLELIPKGKVHIVN